MEDLRVCLFKVTEIPFYQQNKIRSSDVISSGSCLCHLRCIKFSAAQLNGSSVRLYSLPVS